MSSEYSFQKTPPAPILKIEITPPRKPSQAETVVALIDTGADFTLVPLSTLLKIDAPEVRWAYVRGLWSEQRPVTLYLVDLHFEGIVLPGVEVAGLEDDEGEFEDDREAVLGRNILNRLILLLDGPQYQIDVLERRPLKF